MRQRMRWREGGVPMCERAFCLSALERRSAAPLSRWVRHRACTVVQLQWGGGSSSAGGVGRVTGEGWELAADTRVKEPRGHEESHRDEKQRQGDGGEPERQRSPALTPCMSPQHTWVRRPPPPPPVLSAPLFLPSAARSSAPVASDTAVGSSSLARWWRDDWRGEQVMERWQEPSASTGTRSFPPSAPFRCFNLHTFSSSESNNI